MRLDDFNVSSIKTAIKSKTQLNWHFCQITPFIKCPFMAKWVPERGSTLRMVRRLIDNCTIIHCLVLFLFSKVILVSHGSILFLRNSVIVRTIDGGEKWTNHQLPFQVTGPLLFHPRQEDWILGRGVVNGKVCVIFCLLYTTGHGHWSITHMFLACQSATLHANYMRKSQAWNTHLKNTHKKAWEDKPKFLETKRKIFVCVKFYMCFLRVFFM